jgi:hypothetical protein
MPGSNLVIYGLSCAGGSNVGDPSDLRGNTAQKMALARPAGSYLGAFIYRILVLGQRLKLIHSKS